jgi:hypothetical protein
VAGESQLGGGSEDPNLAAAAIIDEDRLAEAELGRDPLPLALPDRGAVQEHPERIAPLAVLIDEDAQDVKRHHNHDHHQPDASQSAASPPLLSANVTRGSAGSSRSRTG